MLTSALSALPLLAPAQLPPADDWLSYAPPQTQLYIEIKDLARLRDQFRRLNIWWIVQQLAGRGDAPATQPSWNNRPEALLGMSREDVVTRVLGARMAILTSNPDQWKQGLVLAQPPSAESIDKLLNRWGAKLTRAGGAVRLYSLRGGIRLAQVGNLLLFGPAVDSDPLWDHTVDLMAGTRAA